MNCDLVTHLIYTCTQHLSCCRNGECQHRAIHCYLSRMTWVVHPTKALGDLYNTDWVKMCCAVLCSGSCVFSLHNTNKKNPLPWVTIHSRSRCSPGQRGASQWSVCCQKGSKRLFHYCAQLLVMLFSRVLVLTGKMWGTNLILVLREVPAAQDTCSLPDLHNITELLVPAVAALSHGREPALSHTGWTRLLSQASILGTGSIWTCIFVKILLPHCQVFA